VGGIIALMPFSQARTNWKNELAAELDDSAACAAGTENKTKSKAIPIQRFDMVHSFETLIWPPRCHAGAFSSNGL
jgi:hypothetical protein